MNTTTGGSQTNGNLGQFGVVGGGSPAPNPANDYQLVFTGYGNLFTGRIIDKATGVALTFNDGHGGLTDILVASDPGAAGFGASGAVLYTTGQYGLFGFVGSGTSPVGNQTDFTADNFVMVPALLLESAAQVNGPYSIETNASIDLGNRRITVPARQTSAVRISWSTVTLRLARASWRASIATSSPTLFR